MPAFFRAKGLRLGRATGRSALVVFVLSIVGIALARRQAPGGLLATVSTASVRTTRLAVAVRSNEAGMEVVNMTPLEWRGCIVTIAGDYASELPPLKSTVAIHLSYGTFARGTDRLEEADGFTRAFRSTDISCVAADGHVEHAVLK